MSSKAKQIGGAKKKFKNAIQFTVIAFVFILYMVPFALVIINSFKSKRDIITNPFSIIGEKGQTLLNYVKAFEKMDYIKAFGNSLFITGLSTFAVIILNALAFWNDYLLPSLVLGKKEMFTLPLSTYSFYGTYSADYGVIMAALVLTVAPILVMYLLLQKQIISGVVAGAVKM